jgi:hypothetical protein
MAAVIKLTITVANLTNVMSMFDLIQVFRSEDGETGDFFEITGATAAAATLLGTETSSFTLNGLTLKLEVDGGDEQTIPFVTADPIAIDDLVDFINDNLTDAVASEDTGAVRITSDTTGTLGTLEITGGTALTELGFTSSQKDNGEDARITLQAGVETYYYDDQSGDPDYYYKVRYYNSSLDSWSDYGPASKGSIGSILPASDLIKAVVNLAGTDGKPVTDRKVVFYNKYVPPTVISDYLIADREVVISTDLLGYAETMLVKGAEVVVSIVGTSIVRHITVPSTGTEFSVNDAIAAADDMFQIQVPDIPDAIRRTL